MNKCLITYYLSFLAVAATSCSFYAMEGDQKQRMQEKLVTIEEQLILKEITKHGVDKVQNKLNDGISLRKFHQDQNKPVFIIRQTFFSTKKDQLTQSIFDAIELRYEDWRSKLPKQSLNEQMRYYVIKDKPAVLVVAKLTGAEGIQKIINQYKSTLINKNDSVEQVVSAIRIGTTFISCMVLFLLINQAL